MIRIRIRRRRVHFFLNCTPSPSPSCPHWRLDFPCRNAVLCAGAIRGWNGGRGRGGQVLQMPSQILLCSRIPSPWRGDKAYYGVGSPSQGSRDYKNCWMGLWTTVGTLHESRDMDFYIFVEKGKKLQDMEENGKVRHIGIFNQPLWKVLMRHKVLINSIRMRKCIKQRRIFV
jgi:hypothetical protein